MLRYLITVSLVLLYTVELLSREYYFTGHSHNDYYQERPLYEAYENFFASIEADIFSIDGELYVAHDKEEIKEERTLKSLYIEPITKIFRENNGKPWKDHDETFILLVDLKSSYQAALHLLVSQLEKYPGVFDPSVNEFAVRVVVSGNMPDPELFENYPDFIFFDGRLNNSYTVSQLQRIILFSNSFRDYSQWDGKGPMPEEDQKTITELISQVHDIGKKIRFWATPDEVNAWEQLYNMNADLINTDKPFEYTQYFNNKKNRK